VEATVPDMRYAAWPTAFPDRVAEVEFPPTDRAVRTGSPAPVDSGRVQQAGCCSVSTPSATVSMLKADAERAHRGDDGAHSARLVRCWVNDLSILTVERKLGQIAQRRIPGAEIISASDTPMFLSCGSPSTVGIAFEQDGLRDLQLRGGSPAAGFDERAQDDVQQVAAS